MDTEWSPPAGPTVFAPFAQDTDYFGPMTQQVMLNFRVPNLDAMLAQLRSAGADVEDEIVDSTYGRFGHASDPEWPTRVLSVDVALYGDRRR